MRDLLVTLIVVGSLPFILRWPRIGIMMYIWVSVMNPHRLSFGFAYDVRWALIVIVVTLIGLLFSRDLKWPPMTALNMALIAFFAWTGVTTVFAVNFDQSLVMWERLMKTAIVALLIPAMFRTREQLRQLIWVIVLSVAYFGVKGGLWVLLTGGENRVYGPPGSYIEDNNYLAMALVMLIPIIRFLQVSEPRRNVRWACTAIMLLCGISVLGSYSRGAFLGVTAMGILWWWKGKNKLAILLAAAILIPPIVSFMPEKWHERMDTINTYQEDSSANNRLNSWATMFNIAKASPFVGAGFEASTTELYERYSPDPTFGTQAAHSIYFQALGEHGFVGLALYLLLYFAYWRQAGALSPRHRRDRLRPRADDGRAGACRRRPRPCPPLRREGAPRRAFPGDGAGLRLPVERP